mgnify:CR=1 FL=1
MDLFKSGQKINLYFPKDENLVSISCTISNVKNDRLYVELPQYFMRYIEYLEDGKKLTAKVFSKMGTIDFNTIVISSPLEDNFIIELDYNAIKFTPSEEIPSVNAIENLIIKSEETPILVKTFEISTEYIKFDSDKKFEIENSFDCTLNLPKDYGTINFKATIVEIDPIYDNEYKAVYSNMKEEDRQTLLYYMYMYSNSAD